MFLEDPQKDILKTSVRHLQDGYVSLLQRGRQEKLNVDIDADETTVTSVNNFLSRGQALMTSQIEGRDGMLGCRYRA